MILPFIAILVLGSLVVVLWWFVTEGAHQRELDRLEARRQADLSRVRQVQRQAEAEINRVATDALQQMAKVAAEAKHSASCLCDRCISAQR
ncbi:hypothetical protein HWD35_05835 [Tsukamurella tyrosinosolvens]|uniref:hypothetical protein n=1 Tax=Tsukamurella tyrosinosolvens TaxID=57704 RepID=UPI001CE1A49A|nr:hypothetical protein [Tsukamurella tyrosinosolvens]MCA4994227.1 hypothetical protein [Tsukamurella tyrosinosolvens]